MAADLLVVVRTARHRYALRHADLLAIQVAAGEDLAAIDPQQRPCSVLELGPLLDPADCSEQRRQRALVVGLRRRLIALLVDQVETFEPRTSVLALPELLQRRLEQPWANGVLPLNEELVVVLDIRAVAMSAARQEAVRG